MKRLNMKDEITIPAVMAMTAAKREMATAVLFMLLVPFLVLVLKLLSRKRGHNIVVKALFFKCIFLIFS